MPSPIETLSLYLKACRKKQIFITAKQLPSNCPETFRVWENIPRLITDYQNGVITSTPFPPETDKTPMLLDLKTLRSIRYFNKTLTVYTRPFSTTVTALYTFSESPL